MKYLTISGLSRFLNNLKKLIPSKTSQLTNDSGYITADQVSDVTGYSKTEVDQLINQADSNAVHLTGNETIGGSKTFTSSPTLYYGAGDNYLSFLKSSSLIFGTAPQNTQTYSIRCLDKNDIIISEFSSQSQANGINNLSLRVRNTDGTNIYDRRLNFNIDANGLTYFAPNIDNICSLGVADYQWKSVYANSYYLGSTQFGDIVTHNASEFLTSHQSLSNYVTLDGAQTITGDKTFTGSVVTHNITPETNGIYTLGTDNLRWQRINTGSIYNWGSYIFNTGITAAAQGTQSTALNYNILNAITSDSSPLSFCFQSLSLSNTLTQQSLNLRLFDGDGALVTSESLLYRLTSSGLSFYPLTSGQDNLGTSTNQWKEVYANNYYGTSASFSYGIDAGCIELNADQGRSDGGYIDFHYNQSTADFTSRIIENASGQLDINGIKFRSDASYLGVSIEGVTIDLNDLYSSTKGATRIYYATTNGGTNNITNKPVGQAFILYSHTVRYQSASDYVIEQLAYGATTIYFRSCTNGTWTAWKTFSYSDHTHSQYLTEHQSLSNYSTLANTVKSLSISGKTITVTPGSGDAYTLTTQDTVYTHPTTAGNKHIPSGGSSGQFLGWNSDGTAKWVNNPNSDTKNTAGSTDTSSKIFLIGATSQAANPQTYSHDTAYVGTDGCLYSNGTKVLTAHQSLSNYSTLANTVKSLSISGKTITVTPGSGDAYTLTTQDTVYTHPTAAGNKHIPSGGSTNQYLKYSASGTAVWADLPTIPTKTSQLTNDSGFLTAHQSLSNYLTKTTNISEMGRYIDMHYDNATAAYDYDVRLYVDSQGTAKGGGSFKIAAASVTAPNLTVTNNSSNGIKFGSYTVYVG